MNMSVCGKGRQLYDFEQSVCRIYHRQLWLPRVYPSTTLLYLACTIETHTLVVIRDHEFAVCSHPASRLEPVVATAGIVRHSF